MSGMPTPKLEHLGRATSVATDVERSLLARNYRVERLLASGGMGVVVAAKHEMLGQLVAIKFMLPGQMNDMAVARFLREARTTAMIDSEHVARVFDCGTLEDGAPYI